MLGDEQGGLNGVAVHSLTLKAMVKADLIDFVPDSQGKLTIPTYLGKTVLVDDSMPVTGAGANRVFTTYIFGPGAIGYGERRPKVPVEVERQALKGMGQEYIVEPPPVGHASPRHQVAGRHPGRRHAARTPSWRTSPTGSACTMRRSSASWPSSTSWRPNRLIPGG